MFSFQFTEKKTEEKIAKGIKFTEERYRPSVRAIIYDGEKLLMLQSGHGDYLFPGGGMECGETKEEALRREIQEETGYTQIEVGPCIGTVFNYFESRQSENTLLRMESFYYVCRLTGHHQEPKNMEAYETRLQLCNVFVTPKEAWEQNRRLMQEDFAGIWEEKIPWSKRETRVLEELVYSKVDRLALEVYGCGEIIRNADRTAAVVDEKAGHANFVTSYDKKVQEELQKRLLYWMPDSVFVGEEEDIHASIEKGYAFIVDPIDGTTNFIKDCHASCISVGLTKDGKQEAGIVYNPYLDEMFTAVRGRGAWLNGKRIHVSDEPLENGIVLFGTSPYYEELSEQSFQTAYSYFQKALDVRRSGSAAIDLCSIACGRAELFFELRLSPWDYAAGSLIVEEAGGVVTTMDGEPVKLDRPCSVKASNREETV